jgi:hypothetical protein
MILETVSIFEGEREREGEDGEKKKKEEIKLGDVG